MLYDFKQFYKISENIKSVIVSKEIEAKRLDILQKRIMKFISQLPSDREYIIHDEPTSAFKADIEHICDFLNNIPESEQMKQLNGNYEQILSNANKWSTISQKRGEKIKDKEESGLVPIMSFDNGYVLVQLTTKANCEREGNVMGHCVGGYDPKKTKLFSLRDSDNNPHVTIQTDFKNNIKQIKGNSNLAPLPKYQQMIRLFLSKNPQYTVRADGENIGMEKYNDKYYFVGTKEWNDIYKNEIKPMQQLKFMSIQQHIHEKD
jgi:hypothetical protein